MNGTALLAFVITPALVLGMAWGAAWLNHRHYRKQRHEHH
jgi:hypothetical protein